VAHEDRAARFVEVALSGLPLGHQSSQWPRSTTSAASRTVENQRYPRQR
jgi:hypothetical protein